MRIPISAVSQLRLPCFPQIVTKIRIDLKLVCIDIISSFNETGNIRKVQISFSVLFVFKRLHMQFILMSQNFACGCEMWSDSQLLFLTNRKCYPILEVYEFQFWLCRDSSCHVFLRILAVLRLHLIDPSSIEHNSAC